MEKKEAKQNRHVKAEAKQMNKIRFLGKFIHTHEQAYVHIIKPACAGKIMHMQVSAQKP